MRQPTTSPGDTSPPQTPRGSPRDHLANERTLLAWSRTGIAVIALGFVVARFGLLLRELNRNVPRHLPQGTSTAFGVTIIIGGIAMMVLALIHYLRTGQAIERQEYSWSPLLGGALLVSLAGVGVLLGVYLILSA